MATERGFISLRATKQGECMSIHDRFTKRQREVLSLLPASKEQLAQKLSVAQPTVEGHIGNIRRELEDEEAVVFDRATEEYIIGNPELRNTEFNEVISPPNSTSKSDNAKKQEGGDIERPPGLIDQLKNEGLTYQEITEEYDVTTRAAQRLLQKIREEGFKIEFKETGNNGQRIFYIPDESGKRFKFGDGDGTYNIAVISDTHLGSSEQKLEELNDFYDRVAERDVDFVLHCGDISDGWKIYRGHINEVIGEASGWKRLRRYVIENYPQRDGIETFFISGNHDHKLHKRSGLYFGESIANVRDDLHWLGDSQATVVLDAENDIDIEMIHPDGGQPYTVGYRLQTLYRERGLDKRPTIALVGHLHGSMYAKTEGVFGFYAGCWKGTTTYGKRKGHEATIGGWFLNLEIEDGVIRRLNPEWIDYSDSEEETGQFDIQDIEEMTE